MARIGELGQNWINGSVNDLLSVKDVTVPEEITNLQMNYWNGEKSINDETISYTWKNFYVSYANSYTLYFQNGSKSMYGQVDGSALVRYSGWVYTSSNSIKNKYLFLAYSQEPFTTSGINSYSYTYDDKTAYYMYFVTQANKSGSNSVSATAPACMVSSQDVEYGIDYAKQCWAMLYGADVTGPLMPGFTLNPESSNVYPDGGGIGPQTTYGDMFSTPQIVIPRPPNDYNPDDQTSTPEWREETTSNVMPLMNINFPDLFPFSLMFDLKDLSEKVTSLTVGQAGSGEYSSLRIPFKVSNVIDEQIELDLTPLYDVLMMARPFNLVLLIVALVVSLVLFWRAILTGD